jgi:4-hydroxybenzoate polyprenyltransferase
MSTEAEFHAPAAGRREAVVGGLIELARPKDWIKNVFVVAPVPFALAAGAHFDLNVFVWGLCGFCLVNSAIYTFNDWRDAAADRLHPQKRHRPLAAATVPPTAAAAQIAAFLLAGIGLCLATGRPAATEIALVYIAVNVAYSLRAKHVALLDVFFLSSGFVIRVLLGCALVSAAPSAWLLLCTSALALFLGFAKRRADLMAGVDRNYRPALRQYSQHFLDQAMAICAGVALLSYALYSIESKVLLPGREMASMPFVAYGILNYLRLAIAENAGGSPVEVALSSRSSQLCVLGWAAAVTWSLGLW